MDNGATAIISARNAMGQVAGVQAMDLAIKKAKQFGIGAVGVRESNHFGAAAYYTMRALDHDAIGFASTNGIQVMAPYGGVTPSLSNTPIAYAIPAATERPLMLDMAVSVVAAGKVALARRKGESIPPDWALTATGEPTDDPSVATLMAPVGGPKGYGLAVVLDALCGVLTGALFGQDVRRGGIPNTPQAMGHLFMALDIAHMMPVEEFKQRMDVQSRQMRTSEVGQRSRAHLPARRNRTGAQRALPARRHRFRVSDRRRPGCHGSFLGHSFTFNPTLDARSGTGKSMLNRAMHRYGSHWIASHVPGI